MYFAYPSASVSFHFRCLQSRLWSLFFVLFRPIRISFLFNPRTLRSSVYSRSFLLPSVCILNRRIDSAPCSQICISNWPLHKKTKNVKLYRIIFWLVASIPHLSLDSPPGRCNQQPRKLILCCEASWSKSWVGGTPEGITILYMCLEKIRRATGPRRVRSRKSFISLFLVLEIAYSARKGGSLGGPVEHQRSVFHDKPFLKHP